MNMQQRDFQLLADFVDGVLLDTPTIGIRHFPKDQTGEACRRRLRLLTDAGLLRVLPPLVCCVGDRRGRLPTIYCLTPVGAELLTEQTGLAVPRLLRGDPKPGTLMHRLGIARDVILPVRDACAAARLPPARWILEQDIIPGSATDAPFHKRFVLYEVLTGANNAKLACRPDASCWLQVPGQGPGQQNALHDLLIYWEYDRSSVALKQIQSRMEPYRLLIASETFRKHWPTAAEPTVRVFFVTQSTERAQNVAAAIKDVAGAECVRLTTTREMKSDTFLFAPIWKTPAGERRPIIRAVAS